MSASLITNFSEVPTNPPSAGCQVPVDAAPEAAPLRLVWTSETETQRDVSPWALSRTRRCLDFLTALFALALFAPLMFILAIVVALESDGPAIFMQERMGRNGTPFTLYKFRSMVSASHKGSPITVSGDQRITRVGAFLRRFKLDELPQFLNVLKGDMSLVGPRPKLPHHEGLHMPFRPGVTGAATLAFRFEEEMLKRIPADQLDRFYDLVVKPRKAKLDWEYMQTATFGADLRLIWKTAKICFSKDVDRETTFEDFLPQLAEVERKHPASSLLHPTQTPLNAEPVRHQAAQQANGFTLFAESAES